jgi:EAL domain-containing protein (putative c-di-GMP-specific phosphodiesterase class I)
MEITESTAMQDPGRMGPLFNRLRSSGLRLAIDDFGAGYSSLSRLRELPVQVLKIDRSFLVDAPQEPEAAGLIGAALALADALGMEAVAEGVENERQREFLLERGCRFAQGFLLSRPVPAGRAEAMLPALDPAR